jgi:ABC-type transporter Mla subunit MlaD
MNSEERFEKIESAIRDLIVVSRTLLDSVGELREAQSHTDEKLNVLIQAQAESELKVSRLADTVDRLIRFRGPNGHTL